MRAMVITCYRKILRISYKDHDTNGEVCAWKPRAININVPSSRLKVGQNIHFACTSPAAQKSAFLISACWVNSISFFSQSSSNTRWCVALTVTLIFNWWSDGSPLEDRRCTVILWRNCNWNCKSGGRFDSLVDPAHPLIWSTFTLFI